MPQRELSYGSNTLPFACSTYRHLQSRNLVELPVSNWYFYHLGMGCYQSKPVRANYIKGKYDLNKPLPPLPVPTNFAPYQRTRNAHVSRHRAQSSFVPESHNCWLAGEHSGFSTHLPEVALHAQGITLCYRCHKPVNAESDNFVWHNLDTCKMNCHSHCMRTYLHSLDGNSRVMARPRCFRCGQPINVRIVPRTRQNHMGLDKFDEW